MNPLKQLRNKQKAMNVVKRIMGKNIGNVLKTMDHTSKCSSCEAKLNNIFVCAGIAQNDTRFGVLKLVKHLPKCATCRQAFMSIASHANCEIQIEKLDGELAKVNI